MNVISFVIISVIFYGLLLFFDIKISFFRFLAQALLLWVVVSVIFYKHEKLMIQQMESANKMIGRHPKYSFAGWAHLRQNFKKGFKFGFLWGGIVGLISGLDFCVSRNPKLMNEGTLAGIFVGFLIVIVYGLAMGISLGILFGIISGLFGAIKLTGNKQDLNLGDLGGI